MAETPNDAQVAYWNDSAGPTWVRLQSVLDEELLALGEAAMAVLAPGPGETLLDVGCGCGDTTLELARRVGHRGQVTGADISAPMLGVAMARAEAEGLGQVTFLKADAQTHAFEPADGIFSRFGVMFFADPTAAFANLRRALKPGGRIAFVCWRRADENQLMSLPMQVAAPLLPTPPAPYFADGPGPFAFADRDKLHGILRGAGFVDVAIEPHDAKVGWRQLETALTASLSMGPLGAALRQSPELRTTVEPAVRAALGAHAGPDGVKLDTATWIVRAS